MIEMFHHRITTIAKAKATESHFTQKLVVDSDILKDQNTEVEVLVGHNNSSTTDACTAAANHPIIKLSNVNYTSGKKN